MNHPNYTLKFPRTSREVYGAPATFKRNPDHIVGLVGIAALIFVAGILVGGAI